VATVRLYEVTMGSPSGGPATLVDFHGNFDTDPHVRAARLPVGERPAAVSPATVCRPQYATRLQSGTSSCVKQQAIHKCVHPGRPASSDALGAFAACLAQPHASEVPWGSCVIAPCQTLSHALLPAAEGTHAEQPARCQHAQPSKPSCIVPCARGP